MQKANWIIKNNEIFSLDFDDFYYNIKAPLKEREGIYVNNAFASSKQRICIVELGFGLGLNFLLSVKKAKENKQKLEYVAFEKYYHDIEDLCYFATKFNLEFDENFIKNYPPCKHGFYSIKIDKDINLTLIFGDINDTVNEIDFRIDVVFADGFSPSKNQEMFSTNVLEKLLPFLNNDAILLSYSSNSKFKKTLNELGFIYESLNLGIKRESTKATYKKQDELKRIDGYFYKNPIKIKNIAIIGGGVAGAMLAYELSKYDLDICVFEQNKSLANEGSGNKIGLLTALIQNPNSTLGAFSQYSYWHSSKLYKSLGLELEGVFEHAYNEELKKRFKLNQNNPLFRFYKDFAFLKDGGSLEPCKIVPKVFKISKAKIFLEHKLLSFNELDDKVELVFDKAKFDFDAVVFATGVGSLELFKNLPISNVRGQVTWLKAFKVYKHPISSNAYLTGIKDGIMILGATYDRWLIKEANDEDDFKNLNNFKQTFKKDLREFKIGNRVGYRCYSSDRFPIVGAYFDYDKYKKLYKTLHFTKHKPQNLAPKSRVFLSIAHGSRGLASAYSSAKLISSIINDIPSGMPKSFEHSLNPARFLIRDLKKGLAK